MRPLNGPHRRSLLIGATAVAAIAVCAAPAYATAHSTKVQTTKQGDERRCVRLDFIDSLQKTDTNQPTTPPQDEGVGYQSTWLSTDKGTSSDPTLTGVGAGSLDLIADTPGQSGGIAWIDEVFQLSGGAFHTYGTYNRPAALAGQWVTMPAVGISGIYAGLAGVMRWTVSDSPPYPTHAIAVMCAGPS